MAQNEQLVRNETEKKQTIFALQEQIMHLKEEKNSVYKAYNDLLAKQQLCNSPQ